MDGRRRVQAEVPNFWAYYPIDQEEHLQDLLQLEKYGQGSAGSWVLLEPEPESVSEAQSYRPGTRESAVPQGVVFHVVSN